MRAATFIALAGVLGATPAGAGLSGSAQLVGTIAKKCFLRVEPAAGASAIDLGSTIAQGAARLVGTIVETCNKTAGYRVYLRSANGAALGRDAAVFRGTDPANEATLAYSVSYAASAPLDFANGVALAREVTRKSDGERSEIKIWYSGNETLVSDSYSDTLLLLLVVD